ncbi:protein obstructor-E-like [Eriocheir sinensis]|uniref:protein obstructor-E-like n=1 Tax=Eriocheir sinensis TaxID=95602 RepID=UPI0021C58B23|nr:protein obstructor-E-like [Eriocheir sinensis]
MLRAAVLSALLALATAQGFGYNECPEKEGVQTYPHPNDCNSFYLCVNGTLTEEYCENGLLFDGKGAVHNYCNYYWAVDCGERKAEVIPLARGACEYSFGLFSQGPCETYFTKCVYGEPIDEPCTPGLAYDERIHGCNWPDLLEYCNPEEVVGFKCPAYVDSKDPAAKFLPHPRYATQDCGRYIVCVEGLPRLVGCGDYTVFSPDTLTCEEPEYVPKCANYFKK